MENTYFLPNLFVFPVSDVTLTHTGPINEISVFGLMGEQKERYSRHHYCLITQPDIMIWHTVISLFCAAASSSAFVTPIGRVVQSKQPKALSIHYASAATHETVTNTARTLAVAGRIPWGNFILNYKQRIQLVSIVRKETHILDISVVSCRKCMRSASS